MLAIVVLRTMAIIFAIVVPISASSAEMTLRDFLFEPGIKSNRTFEKKRNQLEKLENKLTAMPTAGRRATPIGHYGYCKTYPSDCKPHKQIEEVVLDEVSWYWIVLINSRVNGMFEPMTDEEQYGTDEFWTYPVSGYADCEDYVLEKRRQLMANGFPASALLITFVLMKNGEGHAILTIRTDRGDLTLDSLESRILPWQYSPYKIVGRQSPEDAGKWENVIYTRQEEIVSASGPL